MADLSVTGEKPAVKSFDDFDVFSGKSGTSREEYKAASFHSPEGGDARFEAKAKLMGTTGSALEAATESAKASIKVAK